MPTDFGPPGGVSVVTGTDIATQVAPRLLERKTPARRSLRSSPLESLATMPTYTGSSPVAGDGVRLTDSLRLVATVTRLVIEAVPLTVTQVLPVSPLRKRPAPDTAA